MTYLTVNYGACVTHGVFSLSLALSAIIVVEKEHSDQELAVALSFLLHGTIETIVIL